MQPVKPVTYSVVKSALVGLTRYLASYWADKKVRVNAISPGGVYNGQPEDFVARLTNLIPLGRMAANRRISGGDCVSVLGCIVVHDGHEPGSGWRQELLVKIGPVGPEAAMAR